MDSFTERIAGFIEQLTYEQLSSAAIEAGKRSIIDCLGVAVAGCDEDVSRITVAYAGDAGRPEAGVVGGGFKTSVDQAAWINGTRAHALDYDDYFAPEHSTPYHPTAAILPAVLAAGEKLHVSGREILLACVTGFEVEAGIAVTCAEKQYNLGWHTTATLGGIGAAAAVAKILNLDEARIRMALGIAASLSGGLRKNFGTMTKPLHAGNAARNGVMAAMLAQKGFTADKNILDSPLSFGEVLSGQAGRAVAARRENGEFYIVSPGVALKPYPSCAYSHWAIDAALDLRREAGITADDILEIECHTSSALPQVLIHSRPQTALEGKFSLEFCVAAALIDNEVTLKQFTDAKIRDSAVQGLMQKVKYVHPPEMGSGLVGLGGRLVIRLQNGKVYSRKVAIAKGDPGNPLSREELVGKYRDCVRLSLSAGSTDKSLDRLLNLEQVEDIAELMDIYTFETADFSHTPDNNYSI